MPHVTDTCTRCDGVVIPGDGAVFFDGRVVHVPCYVGQETLAQPPAVRPAISRDVLLGIHVLLVDDSPSTLEMLQAALEYCGAFVTTATSAREAGRSSARCDPASS